MSIPTGGNFDCAENQTIKLMAEAMFDPKDLKNAQYLPDIDALKAVQSISNVRFTDLEDPTKDTTVNAVWMDDCDDDEPADCTEDCVIDGPEIGALCKDFTLDVCFEKSYSVFERKFRMLGSSANIQQEIAIGLANKMKLMDEEWARRTVSTLDAISGLNANTTPYTVSATSTSIPATAWNPDLFGYFAATKYRNKFPNAALLFGGLMEQTLWNVSMQTSDPTGASAARKVASMGNVFSDSFLTETTLGHKAAFLIAPSALGVATKAYYTPYGAGREEIAGGNKQLMYTIVSPASGIRYDVTYQIACVIKNGVKDWKHTWQLKTKGAVLTSPVFCNTAKTGVLQFLCA